MPEAPAPRLRGEARNEAIRAGIAPLAPGERPGVITIAAVITLLLAIVNGVLAATGYEVDGENTTVGGIIFGAIMLGLAAGLWRVSYWAAIGFQVVLGLTALSAGLALLVASNLAAVALSLTLLVTSGALFWFLIRAMARMQAPRE